MTPNPLHGAIDEREDSEGDALRPVPAEASRPRATGDEPSGPARQLPEWSERYIGIVREAFVERVSAWVYRLKVRGGVPGVALPDFQTMAFHEWLDGLTRQLLRTYEDYREDAYRSHHKACDRLEALLRILSLKGQDGVTDAKFVEEALRIADTEVARRDAPSPNYVPPSLAQGIEAGGRDAQRLGAKPESPVAEGDAPPPSSSSP